MMTPSELEQEVVRLHRRLDDAAKLIAAFQNDEGSGAHDATGVVTTIASLPTSPLSYYAVQLTTVGGPEVEGAAPTISGLGTVVLAANLGNGSPAAGQNVTLRRVGGRWLFRHDG